MASLLGACGMLMCSPGLCAACSIYWLQFVRRTFGTPADMTSSTCRAYPLLRRLAGNEGLGFACLPRPCPKAPSKAIPCQRAYTYCRGSHVHILQTFAYGTRAGHNCHASPMHMQCAHRAQHIRRVLSKQLAALRAAERTALMLSLLSSLTMMMMMIR